MECLDRASSDQPSAANLNWIVAVAASTARAARLRTASAAGEPVLPVIGLSFAEHLARPFATDMLNLEHRVPFFRPPPSIAR